MFKEYDRISTTDNELATIKYIGKLPESIWGPDVIALGLEWDEAERGKNSGSIEGVSYFKTDIEGAGSFLKSTNKKIVKERYDFIESLIRQYANEENETILSKSIVFGTKIAESYGFHKLNSIQSDFKNLPSISLERKNIYKSFNNIENSKSILANLVNVTNLDLSFNLFNDLNEVWGIIDHLPNLESLNLNGNRFFNRESIPTTIHPKIKCLKLASTNIKTDQVTKLILPKFVGLRDLSLAGNQFNDADLVDFTTPHLSLEDIDLSYNKMTRIPEFLESCINVHSINLAHNQIKDVQLETNLEKIYHLDIRHNEIQDWTTIDKLSQVLPNLKLLRINGNPIFKDLSIEEMLINLVGRFECQLYKDKSNTRLCKINGSFLNEDEIQNFELYFISKVKLGVYRFNMRSERWNRLMTKYKMAPKPELKPQTIIKNQLSFKKIRLVVHLNEDTKINRVFLIDNTVLRLKGIISKHLRKSILKINIFYFINEFEESKELKIKQYLDDDLALLDSFGFYQQQNLYVSIKEKTV